MIMSMAKSISITIKLKYYEINDSRTPKKQF